jgi:hypothetical protein
MSLNSNSISTKYLGLFWDTVGFINQTFKPLFIWRHLRTEIIKHLLD